ncbi:MAG: hypothetical protein JWM59_4165 [Verrucomicrobiales bacterium]|nr:hypothetical protein [Verrucomicrobiales bacterium]
MTNFVPDPAFSSPPPPSSPTPPASAEFWAEEAAKLPLAFAQVREDPRLDLALARRLPPGAAVVMIASGGDSAACLARLPLSRLHLVDINPAQLALARCKLDLAATVSPEEAAAWLGHAPLPVEIRAERIAHRLDSLGLPAEALGPLETLASLGPDHAGRYERCFAELQTALSPWREALITVLGSADPPAAAAAVAPDTPLGQALDTAFTRVMSLANLVCLFGEGATRNPRQPFSCHFLERLRLGLERFPARENPFLHQLLTGTFPISGGYDWLSEAGSPGGPPGAEPVFHLGAMTAALESMPAESMDFAHLSNILDWLSPAEAEGVLAAACRVLRPGGRIILRQLNSTLDIAALDSGIAWDLEEGARFEQADRSFFYPGIFTGRRR